LVDKQGRVRGIYDGLKTDELDRLKKDIEILLKAPIDKDDALHLTSDNNPA
jgi:hypothetical protein